MENPIEICHLPSNVQEMIYRYLGANELLSLRRTCKETKTWVETMDESISTSTFNNDSRIKALNRWKNYQYVIKDYIDEHLAEQINKILESKLETIVINFWIQNETIRIYQFPNFQKFLEIYCPNIRQLKLRKFFDCVSEAEWNFFQALPNLEELEFEEISIFLYSVSTSNFSRVPSCLKNLRSLRFNMGIKITIKDGLNSNLNNSWIYNPLQYCPNLEVLEIPMIFITVGDEPEPVWNWENASVFEHPIFLMNIIDSLRSHNWSGKLKYLEFKWRHCSAFNDDHLEVARLVQELIHLCKSKGVKLLNVPTPFCQFVNHGECILSVLHWASYNRAFISTKLPDLESLHIDSTFVCNYERVPDFILSKCWPKLKSVKLSLGTDLETRICGTRRLTSGIEIVRLLLVDSEPQPGLQNFKLKFRKTELTNRPRECVTRPSFITAHSIFTNFPNLINLSLVGWDTVDMEFSQLWERLPLLETLSIRDCSSASDLAFIGRNPKRPSFLKLKNLKKLEMNFTYMPYVTERVFKQVFGHMEVKELVLRSSSVYPVNTAKCISVLSKGKVAATMDKITLDLEGLRRLSEDKYIELRNRFRSFR